MQKQPAHSATQRREEEGSTDRKVTPKITALVKRLPTVDERTEPRSGVLEKEFVVRREIGTASR